MASWILHVDMDAFFAAVEKRDNPKLQHKPVIIGGHPNKYPRGVVSTCCYEARKYGVRSAMSSHEAFRRCPNGIFVLPNHDEYLKVSREIMDIFYGFSPLVEPLSIDEAFIDVTGCEKLFGTPLTIAKSIQARVLKLTGLTCSIGIAPNKFLAKLASDLKKPNGITLIKEDEVSKILDPLSVGKIWGIGPKQQEKLGTMGIKTIGNLKKLTEDQLTNLLGISGTKLWSLARGIDLRQVSIHSKVKSISNEQTFMEDIDDKETIRRYIINLSDKVSRRMRIQGLKGKTVTLKLRFSDFKTITSQITLDNPGNLPSEICKTALTAYNDNKETKNKKIRLIGVGVSNLCDEDNVEQISFFEDRSAKDKEQNLQGSIDNILKKYGDEALYRASFKKK